MAAVVAGDAARRPVEHERDVAVRALPHAPAHAAGEEVRPAAAVEEHDRLLAPPAHLVERLARALVEGAAHARHAHQLDGRQAAPVHALWQLDPLEPQPALGPGRGAACHQHGARQLRAPLRNVARVVARVLLLLVGRVVLLVDHDQADVRQRREHGRARAHAHASLAAAKPDPLVVALAGPELRVQHGHLVAEALLEAPGCLRRERDLRHENDCAAARREGGLAGADVDLGLAAAGRAGEEDVSTAAREQRFDALQRAFLRVGEPGGERRLSRPPRAHARRRRRSPPLLHALERDQPAPRERAQAGVRAATCPTQLRGRERACAQLLEGGPLPLSDRRPAAEQRLAPRRGELRVQHHPRAHARSSATACARRQHEAEPARGRGAVLLGHPQPEAHEVGRHLGIERGERLDQPLGRHVALVREPHHHAEHPLAAEWDDEHAAHGDALEPPRHAVIERPA